MSEDKGIRRKSVLSWAFYDWANSAFSTTVVAGFFPVFFREYWSAGGDIGETTLRLGYANSLAGIIVAALAPLLGAVADRGGTKKKFLLFFAIMGIVMTGSLYMVTRGDWMLAALLYVVALIGFSGGNIFYDSLIIGVAEPRKMDFTSALGFSMGYLGGGLLFSFNVCMLLWPQTFGLADASVAVRLSFLSVAVWWALFSIPIFLFVEEPRGDGTASGWSALSAGCRQLAATFREIRQLRMVFLFLIGYWFYIDGVDTVIRMAVDYGMALGFQTESLLIALAITQAVGFPAAILFGKIGEKLGTKTGIFIGIGVYVGVTVWGFFMDQTWEFYGLAVAIGMVQGGIQSLSRSFYTQLIPQNKAAEFFGFYNMLGKFATVIGPVMMGWVSVLTGNPRYSILSLIILFAIGGYMLYKVDAEEGRRMARSLEKL
jgi:MFS transporter, UMF1 family